MPKPGLNFNSRVVVGEARAAFEEPATAVAAAQAQAQRDAAELEVLKNDVKDLAANIKAQESSASPAGHRMQGVPIK